MTISTAAKVGGGILATAAVPTTVYAASDHIFLYSVEREVINKDLKFTIEGPAESSPKKITIKAPQSTETDASLKLEEGNSWICTITIKPKSEGETVTGEGLVDKLKANLPDKNDTTIDDLSRKNKELLVRVCAKHRKDGHSSSSVEGELNIKEQTTGNTFLFEEDSDLNVLLAEKN